MICTGQPTARFLQLIVTAIQTVPMSLTGIDDFIDLGNDPLFDIDSNISVSAWLNKYDTTSSLVYMVRRSGSIQYQATWLGSGHPNNPNQFRLNVTAVSNHNNNNAHPVSGSWHFVAMTYDGDSVRFYFDGQPDGANAATGGLISVNVNNMIGQDNSGNFSRGKIDEVRLYNRVLNGTEIMALYDEDTTNLPTGLNSNLDREEIELYPNPVEETLILKWPHAANREIEIYNNFGQVVYSERVSNARTSINLSNQEVGYLLFKSEFIEFYECLSVYRVVRTLITRNRVKYLLRSDVIFLYLNYGELGEKYHIKTLAILLHFIAPKPYDKKKVYNREYKIYEIGSINNYVK